MKENGRKREERTGNHGGAGGEAARERLPWTLLELPSQCGSLGNPLEQFLSEPERHPPPHTPRNYGGRGASGRKRDDGAEKRKNREL